MKRRSFLQLLAAVPFLSKLSPEVKTVAIDPQGFPEPIIHEDWKFSNREILIGRFEEKDKEDLQNQLDMYFRDPHRYLALHNMSAEKQMDLPGEKDAINQT